MSYLDSLIRPNRPVLTALGVSVVILVTCGSLGGIFYAEVFAPELRGPTRIPSDVHTVRLCPSIDITVHEMQEHVREWEAVGEAYRRVDTALQCDGSPPDGVVWVQRCSVGAVCFGGNERGMHGDAAEQMDVEGGRVIRGAIYVRGKYERQDPHVWHELGKAFGWAVADREDGSDGHDEHEGRVMSAEAGWSWEGLKERAE